MGVSSTFDNDEFNLESLLPCVMYYELYQVKVCTILTERIFLRIGYNFLTIKMIHILDKSRPVQIYLNIKRQEIINHKIEFSHNTIIHENLSQTWAVKFEMNFEIHAWLVFKWKKRSEAKGDSQTSFGQIIFIIINTFCPI